MSAASGCRILIFAALLGAMRATTGTLRACIGFHLTFQVTAQFLTSSHWNLVVTDDPDLALSEIAFVAAPFLSTALLLGVLGRTGNSVSATPVSAPPE
ncbi:hypothetical protein [Nocardia donostiensis]|uniref:Uncharacterized protein n=1 Tax=Nocardia donostiensis TaxID=1538463 RepID=A0A1V2TEK3_9NOCA|nr:hypothetical protein [Nocardia donostiensis]ONM47915.1 hypothetical protein B0T46_14830 [Nocardia donostiensis]OQS21458.1 hypothetical protein B0T44_07435 [Nocardia donostiensis]